MKKALVYGAGNIFKYMKEHFAKENALIAFLEDDPARWGTTFEGAKIFDSKEINNFDFDVVFVATTRFGIVREKLLKLGVEDSKIHRLLDLEKRYSKDCESGTFEKDGVRISYGSILDRCAIGESFEEEIYKFNSFRDSVVIIDIGMHIGSSVLYFAKMSRVVKIYGYEPFQMTFDRAKFNFGLNPSLEGKIVAKNLGIGDAPASARLGYCSEISSSMSVIGENNSKFMAEHGGDYNFTVTDVDIVDAGTEVAEIIALHQNCGIVCKMDCEGFELRILERLHSAGLLEKLDAIMMERHNKEQLPRILELLSKSGYISFEQGSENYNCGMIYAVRSR